MFKIHCTKGDFGLIKFSDGRYLIISQVFIYSINVTAKEHEIRLNCTGL